MPSRWLLVLVLTVSAASLLGGFALKNRCVDVPVESHEIYTGYCYTDHTPLYGARGFADGRVPYVEEFNEYPPLIGAYQWVSAQFADSVHGFFIVGSMGLLAAGFASTLIMWQAAPDRWKVLAWAAAPGVVLSGFINWDFLAVVCTAAGWFAWRRGATLAAAVWFGLGGAVKLYPAFFLPFLAFDAWRRRDGAGGIRAVVGGFLGLGVPNLVVIAVAPDGWLAIWRFHSERAIHWETPWSFVYDAAWAHDASRIVPAVLMVVALAALMWRQWSAAVDPLAMGTVLVLVFLITGRVYSVQYGLWVIPILVLLQVPWRHLVAVVAVDAAEHLLVFQLVAPADASWGWLGEEPGPWLQGVIVARTLVFAWVAWHVVRRSG